MMDFVLVVLNLRVLLPGSELVTSSVSLFCVSVYSHSKFSGYRKTRRRKVVRREKKNRL